MVGGKRSHLARNPSPRDFQARTGARTEGDGMKISMKWRRQCRRLGTLSAVLLVGYLIIHYGWGAVRTAIEDIYEYQAEELNYYDDDNDNGNNTKNDVFDESEGSKSLVKYADDGSKAPPVAEGPLKAGHAGYDNIKESIADEDASETGESPNSPLQMGNSSSKYEAHTVIPVSSSKTTVKLSTTGMVLPPCTDDACRAFRNIVFQGLALEGADWSNASSSSSLDGCDSDCASFRQTLSRWPQGKPKAVIYVLIRRRTLFTYRQAIRSVDRYFNHHFHYPIVVFAPPELDNEADRRLIKEHNRSAPIYVQIVRFDSPSRPVTPTPASAAAADGRPHAKRQPPHKRQNDSPLVEETKRSSWFNAGAVYDQPIFKSPGLEYVMRLTDDWLMAGPIAVDPFKFMKGRKLRYGFWKTKQVLPPNDHSLCVAVERYINASAADLAAVWRPEYDRWRQRPARQLCRWEVSELALWRSSQYRDFFSYVDGLGGIFNEGWSEQTIKSIALALFARGKEIHQFKEVAYVRIAKMH